MKPAKLFRLIRATWEHEPMKALRALDDAARSKKLWHLVCSLDRAWVSQMLQELTRSKEAFFEIRDPLAWVLARCQRFLQQRKESTPTREGQAEGAEGQTPGEVTRPTRAAPALSPAGNVAAEPAAVLPIGGDAGGVPVVEETFGNL